MKLILGLEFQDKKYTKLSFFSSPAYYILSNVAKDKFCKAKLKVKLWAQFNPKLDWAAVEEPPLAFLWFARYADYQMHVLKWFYPDAESQF